VKRVTTRDPRIDPQPGDEVRNGDVIRRVIERNGEKLLVEGWGQRYWIKVQTWQEWCEQSRRKP
jgi:hypothetical protein